MTTTFHFGLAIVFLQRTFSTMHFLKVGFGFFQLPWKCKLKRKSRHHCTEQLINWDDFPVGDMAQVICNPSSYRMSDKWTIVWIDQQYSLHSLFSLFALFLRCMNELYTWRESEIVISISLVNWCYGNASSVLRMRMQVLLLGRFVIFFLSYFRMVLCSFRNCTYTFGSFVSGGK